MRLMDGYINMKLIVIVFLTLGMLFFCSSCGKGEEAGVQPRDIVIEELNGSAVAGSNGEEWDAYAGLKLVSGDELHVSEDGDLILLFDEDRHLYVDKGASFSVLSEGKPGKGRTAVILQNGRALAGIDSKPKTKDPFTVMTPNAGVTATKKGTVFSAEIIEDGENVTTVVTVVEGSAQVRTILGGSEREQELNEGEEGTYVGSGPSLAQISGEDADKDLNKENASEHNKTGQDGIGDSDAVTIESDPFKDGIVTAYQIMDGLSQKADLASTRRAYKKKLEAWLGLVDLQFTAGDLVLGEPADHITVTEPDVLCFGERGIHLGDPEEEMWRFLGFHLDPLIADEGVSVEGEAEEALDVSTRGFVYSRGGMKTEVWIEDGRISEITMDVD